MLRFCTLTNLMLSICLLLFYRRFYTVSMKCFHTAKSLQF
uniref:Uncharacterized protein n=1 Tax=Anguilla anguilla TaxID=7936 RepID=A0A0E9RHI5_ANGAN